MNLSSLSPETRIGNTRRFVAPLSEYEQGRKLYKARKPITECVTDEMAAGWVDEYTGWKDAPLNTGADKYYVCMMQEVQ